MPLKSLIMWTNLWFITVFFRAVRSAASRIATFLDFFSCASSTEDEVAFLDTLIPSPVANRFLWARYAALSLILSSSVSVIPLT